MGNHLSAGQYKIQRLICAQLAVDFLVIVTRNKMECNLAVQGHQSILETRDELYIARCDRMSCTGMVIKCFQIHKIAVSNNCAVKKLNPF